MENLKINNIDYTYLVGYHGDDILRASFNQLTQKTYQFDFEKWHKSGYWGDNCVLYSIADGNEIVSHVTVNIIDFVVLGQKKRFVQLGTVMTDVDYRNKGLSKTLMEKVLCEWESKCDMIYLFANDSVLGFYPKYGFVPTNEYQAAYTIKELKKTYSFRKLDIDNSLDRDLLYNTAKHAVALSKISMEDNAGLVMFYANYFDRVSFKDSLYYIQDMQAIAIADYEADTLILHEILALSEIEIKDVIYTLAREQTEKAVLGFMPIETSDYEINPFKEEDSTLFVQKNKYKLFEDNELLFPTMSHT